MNKYIKKCLVVYTSLALILVGMAGVTYAITATDADQYVTRSQYAVDMAHLQNKLDEQEAGLMGNINRYRSTNVKFVTWDTPTKYYNTGNDAMSGLYNGGNFNGRPVRQNISGRMAGAGLYDGSTFRKSSGEYTDYSLYRLWNGNYYITKNLFYNSMTSDNIRYQQTLNYAVPVENFPGWYMIVRLIYMYNNNAYLAFSVAKLDPNSTTSKPLVTDTLRIRFKKDLFVYAGGSVTPLSQTKKTGTYSAAIYCEVQNSGGPLGFLLQSNAGATAYRTLTFSSYLDEVTGDYMMDMSGLTHPCSSANASGERNNIYILSTTLPTVTQVIPADNVEYMIGNTYGYYNVYAHSWSSSTGLIPVAAYIGTGQQQDMYWQYEFVDCDNGIKYWHAYHPPVVEQKGAYSPRPVGIHYSLPIVY